MANDPRDLDLRQRALEHVRELSRRYDDIVPREVLLEGFVTPLGRVSYGSFYNGIYRPRQFGGPAALAVVTTPPKDRRDAPYDDGYDAAGRRFATTTDARRRTGSRARLAAAADNRALKAARRPRCAADLLQRHRTGSVHAGRTGVHHRDDPISEVVEFQAALPVADSTRLVSSEDVRRYATREAHYRLHQHRFRENVLRAYSKQCAVCRLRETPLLQAAHSSKTSTRSAPPRS